MNYKRYGKWKRRLWKRLFRLAKGKCPTCGCQMTRSPDRDNSATLDHILPKSKGGPTKKSNLEILCAACNRKKGDAVPAESEFQVKGGRR